MIRSVIRAWATRTIYHQTSFLATKGWRYLSADTSLGQSQHDVKKIRNIGIIAHIDAGKTTTTERMLYYSGFTRRIGDVDEGSTVTDFLPAERARGITIQSAAITFQWPPLASGSALRSPQANAPQFRSSVPHTINLIDTPGHADFTFEVLRSLRVLDGAICILDGVAGVEAQTEQVWRQASLYKIPRIIYVNKLDRDGAAFSKTVKQIGTRLLQWPAVCQIPWWEGTSGRFLGIGDAVRLRGLKWQGSADGTAITAFTLRELENVDSTLASELKRARIALVELLSEHDDAMVEKYLEHDEDHLAIPAADISNSLRKCLLLASGQIVPVFAGASFRNMGVQPLLDAVVDLLPDPAERQDPEVTLGAEARSQPSKRIAGPGAAASQNSITRRLASLSLSPINAGTAGQPPTRIEGCALAFKVVHDARRGVLIYVRVYAGTISKSALFFNTNVRVSERGNRLFRMLAADAAEIQELHAGEIGVIVGLNHARTGDTLVAFGGGHPKRAPPAPWDDLHLQAIAVPPPVFFASVVPRSLSDERQLHEALALLLREDPSLTLAVDDESGQMLLGGMGQLHLEIARDRLAKDFRARADMGSIEIAFRECVLGASAPTPYTVDGEIAGKRAKAGCEAQVKPLLSAPEASSSVAAADGAATHVVERDGNLIEVRVQGADGSGGRKSDATNAALLPAGLSLPVVFSSLANGALGALVRSPAHAYPMHGTHVTVTLAPARDLFGSDSTPGALVAAARHATRAALGEAVRRAGTSLMEPVMRVTISLDEGSLGAVVHDISSARGGHVLSLDAAAAAADSRPDTPPTAITATADSSSPGQVGGDGDVDGDDAAAVDDAETAPMIDVSRIYAPPDPFGTDSSGGGHSASVAARASRPRTIQARVPLQEMVGYLKHLRSLTAGRGTFVMSVDRFERMSSHREKKLLSSLLTAS